MVETAEHPTTTATTAGSEVVLDRYRLLRRLGGGGFGVVWLAHDLKLDRTVAVKRIPAPDADTAKRAQREGVAAARLAHPAIVALHEAGSDEENVFLVSEYVRGATFARLLEEGALSDRDVVEIGVALCDALAHAHKRGIIHRDVKPLNILVPDTVADGGAPAKLTDFGVARIAGDDALTRTGDVVGTLAYMAPEQAEGAEVGEEADLYALGLCLYEGLSGVNPVRGRGAGATARRVGQRLPPLGRLRRDLPLDLCEALDVAVWPHPEERGTLAELRGALTAALDAVDDEPGTIAGGPLEPLAAVAPPRHTTLIQRALAAALAAGLRGRGLALGRRRAERRRGGRPADRAANGRVGRRTRHAAASAPGVAGVRGRDHRLAASSRFPIAPGSSSPPRSPCRSCSVAPLPRPGRCPGRRRCWRWEPSPAPSPRWLPAQAACRGARPPARWAPGGCCWPRPRRGAICCSAPRPTPAYGGTDAIVAIVTSPAIALLGVWAAAAAVLPYLVRGRLLVADIVLAIAWAAGVAAATQAAIGGAPRGLIVGAIVAAFVAVILRASPDARDSR